MKRLLMITLTLLVVALTLASTRVLVIGVGEYNDPSVIQLTGALKDAKAFSEAITRTGENPSINLLLNPTLTGLKVNIFEWARKSEPGETLILYYSGHGYSIDNDTYLIPSDVETRYIKDTAYNFTTGLKSISTDIRAKDVLIIIDACYSGSLVNDDRPLTNAKIKEGTIEEIAKDKGYVFLLSSRSDETSKERPEGGGQFTHYLLKGIEGEANRDNDDKITVKEVYDYLREEVRKATSNNQTPVMVGEREIVIAKDLRGMYDSLTLEIARMAREGRIDTEYTGLYLKILIQKENDDNELEKKVRGYLLSYLNKRDLEALKGLTRLAIIETGTPTTEQQSQQVQVTTPQTQPKGNCLLKVIAGNELAKSGSVYLNGKEVGTLEAGQLTVFDLGIGKYTLVIDGEKIDRQEIVVDFENNYETKEIRIEGKPATRVLRIVTIPPNAKIWIDGRELSSRSPWQESLEVGKAYEIEVYVEGYGRDKRIANVPTKGELIPFTITIPEAIAPDKPQLTYPANNSRDIPTGNVTLKWESKESDLTYRIEFDGKTYTTKNKSYTVSANERGKTYSWKVVAVNEFGKETTSETYSFTTQSNRAPNTPSNLSPSNNVTNQPTTITLSWECSDPDGDAVTYDVYFGTSSNPMTKVSSGQTGKTLNRSNLSIGTTYYWKVVAKDSKGGTTEGPVWRFTTLVAPEGMVLVEKGSFTMGDTWGGGDSDEKPTHKVTFTYDFYIGKYEVTFDEYDAFCNATGRSKASDNSWGRGTRPVIYVSWWDAIAYCNWLSEKEKLPKAYDNNGNFLDKDGRVTTDPSKVVGYRLPTEAEWEYAARGGNKSKGYKYAGSDNVSDVAWYSSNSGSKTQEVGKKAPNELGIYDMSGNVWEWCSDWYDSGYYAKSPTTNPYNSTAGSSRVVRGGSWGNSAAYVRVANRLHYSPTVTFHSLGFRIARTVP